MASRTDGGPASKQAIRYAAGEPGAEDFVNLQRQAPLAKTPPVRSMAPSAMRQAVQETQPAGADVVPFGAPSQNPGQPVTHGADAGPGPGSDVLGLNTGNTVEEQAFKQRLASYMPALMFIQSHPDTSPETRTTLKQLRELM
jgi:hypothetical protein